MIVTVDKRTLRALTPAATMRGIGKSVNVSYSKTSKQIRYKRLKGNIEIL